MDLSRQTELVRRPVPNVLLIGAGATGFHTGLALVGAGCAGVEVWDYDTIEKSNLNRQLYGVENVGRYKAEVLVEMMYALNPDGDYHAIFEEMDPYKVSGDHLRNYSIIINAADNLYFHGMLWKKLKAVSKKHPRSFFYISPRMSAFDMEVQTFITPFDNPWEIFQTKEERMEIEKSRSGCTSGGDKTYGQSVVTTSMVLAGFTVQEVINRVNNEPTHEWFRMDIESGKIEMNERRK